MSLLYLCLALLMIVYIWFGMVVAGAYANMYCLQNLEEPPAWKVWVIVFIWPISFAGLAYDYFNTYFKGD